MTGDLRWHYGPTEADSDPGKMWCYDCGAEVYGIEGGYICSGCDRQEDPEASGEDDLEDPGSFPVRRRARVLAAAVLAESESMERVPVDELAELRERCARQAGVIRQQQLAAERRNRDLDALHVVWCDGGCPSGVHRFQGGDVLVTEELVKAAERNTRRLRGWYEAVKFRYETYGPGPADPSRQFPGTASEWHRQRAERAAGRTDLMPRDTPA